MPFGSIHAFKNQDRKKSLEASGNRSVYLTGDAVWGQECGPALLQEVGPLSKVVLGVVPQVSSWLLRDPRPKDCMSTGIQDRQDHRATFLPQAYRCPGPCRQNCAFWT